jgi:hypothetical protein
MTQLPLALEEQPKAARTAALRHFHARDETPAEALAGEKRAAGQEGAILAWFEDLPAGARKTPWEVAEALGLCINSVRRALSNMVDRGELVDHRGDRRPSGPYGQRSRTWSLP